MRRSISFSLRQFSLRGLDYRGIICWPFRNSQEKGFTKPLSMTTSWQIYKSSDVAPPGGSRPRADVCGHPQSPKQGLLASSHLHTHRLDYYQEDGVVVVQLALSPSLFRTRDDFRTHCAFHLLDPWPKGVRCRVDLVDFFVRQASLGPTARAPRAPDAATCSSAGRERSVEWKETLHF